jgi:multidrug efflux pump subunit AcrB
MTPRSRSILLGGGALALVVLVVGWIWVRGRRPPPPRRVVATLAVDPGAPERTEASVTQLVERTANDLPQLDHVESRTSRDGVVVTAILSPSADPTVAELAWSRALTAARDQLPATTQPASIEHRGARTLHFLVRSALRIDTTIVGSIRPALSAVPGVVAVETCGVRTSEVRVTLDPARLAALGVDAVAIADAVRSTNTASVDELRKQRVGGSDAAPIRLEDAAVVSSEDAPLDCHAFGADGATSMLAVSIADDDVVPALDAAIAKLVLPPKTSIEALDPATATTIGAEIALPEGTRPEELTATALLLAKLASAATEVQAALLEQNGRAFDVDLIARIALKPGVTKAQGREAVARALGSMPGVVAVTADALPATALWVIGPDLGRLSTVAGDVTKAVTGVHGVRGAMAIGTARTTSVTFDVDRAAGARLGIAPERTAALIRLATTGTPAGTTGPLPVRVVMGERFDVADTRALVLTSASGPIPLVELATMKSELGPAVILRRDGQRGVRIDVDAQPSVRTDELLAAARTVVLPAGYGIVGP